MARALSKVAPEWWDYTTLNDAILDDAARLIPDNLLGLFREGFTVKFVRYAGRFLSGRSVGIHYRLETGDPG